MKNINNEKLLAVYRDVISCLSDIDNIKSDLLTILEKHKVLHLVIFINDGGTLRIEDEKTNISILSGGDSVCVFLDYETSRSQEYVKIVDKMFFDIKRHMMDEKLLDFLSIRKEYCKKIEEVNDCFLNDIYDISDPEADKLREKIYSVSELIKTIE